METYTDLTAPPWIEVQGIDNFRDIGGYAIADSTHSVRRRFCYRSADPARVTDKGRAAVTALGITTIYDLRSLDEIRKNNAALLAHAASTSTSSSPPPPAAAAADPHEQTSTLLHHEGADASPFASLPGVTHRPTPVFHDRDFSPAALGNYVRGGPEGFTAAYRDVLAHAPAALRAVLAHVRDRPAEPWLMHCSAGKDRTGVVAALLLKLAGVRDADVAREYALTEVGLAPMRPLIVAYLRRQPGLDADEAGLARMVSAKAENMMAVLVMLREEHGGAEAYVRDKVGFSEEDIAVIKRNLTDETEAIF